MDKTNEPNKMNEINDENIINICIKHLIESTLEENRNQEQFLTEKIEEIEQLINKNSFINVKQEDDKDECNEIGQQDIQDDEDANADNDDNEFSSIFQDEQIQSKNKDYSNIPLKKEKKRKKQKRKYLDIDKMKFYFENEDLLPEPNEKLLNINITQNDKELIEHNSRYIDMKDEIIKRFMEPPKIPFTEKFKEVNPYISSLYMKSNFNTKQSPLIQAQLMCIDTEEAFKNENYSISSELDNFIMKKLNIPNYMDSKSDYENENLQLLLQYLMSWYFSGYYAGRMSLYK